MSDDDEDEDDDSGEEGRIPGERIDVNATDALSASNDLQGKEESFSMRLVIAVILLSCRISHFDSQ